MKFNLIVLDRALNRSQLTGMRRWTSDLGKSLPQNGAIDVYLITSIRMRKLNKEFRRKNQAANVLAFPTPKNWPGDNLGEVYLDPLYIRKHRENPALMLIHGVLHILGYNHTRRGDRIKMEKKEKLLLLKLAVSR